MVNEVRSYSAARREPACRGVLQCGAKGRPRSRLRYNGFDRHVVSVKGVLQKLGY